MLSSMLARLILLLVALPAIALAADAPPPDGPIFVPKPPKPAPAANTAPKPAPQPAIQSRIAAPADPAVCRMTCAQANYFCSAGDSGGDACGRTWSQCVNNCNFPGLDPAAAPAP